MLRSSRPWRHFGLPSVSIDTDVRGHQKNSVGRAQLSSPCCPQTVHFESVPVDFWASEFSIVLWRRGMTILGKVGFLGRFPSYGATSDVIYHSTKRFCCSRKRRISLSRA